VHPNTMQLMAEVRAQELLLEARVTRPERGTHKSIAARVRRIVPDLPSIRPAA
jgi:hypothetical protein